MRLVDVLEGGLSILEGRWVFTLLHTIPFQAVGSTHSDPHFKHSPRAPAGVTPCPRQGRLDLTISISLPRTLFQDHLRSFEKCHAITQKYPSKGAAECVTVRDIPPKQNVSWSSRAAPFSRGHINLRSFAIQAPY